MCLIFLFGLVDVSPSVHLGSMDSLGCITLTNDFVEQWEPLDHCKAKCPRVIKFFC